MINIKILILISALSGNGTTITSTERSTQRQAELLLSMKDTSIYSDRHDDVMYSIDSTIESFEAGNLLKIDALDIIESILEDYKSNGNYLSKHLCGNAMDIVIKSKEKKKILYSLREHIGYRVLDEGSHLHIELNEDC